ncbi:flagellar assembly protein FliH [Aliidiomarina taiwanensis]|uniref:Flagellar assembly protein FliH n=1 Tax=Aliidiomarina taiwanensis TaxID=946228 RepID=A0A432WZ13_9GAMM|nr:flagellar assembly protein FliH [Aliidiomarina taiwanensis]RUO39044.1 flagellar assembly protein FliH [Aliidiomarina taiwanensis]
MSERHSKLWELPDIGDEAAPEPDRKNALNMPLKWAYEPPEEQDDTLVEEKVSPLTAEAVEAIREAARQEGFAEGKQEGFQAGHKEGFEAGFAEGEKAGFAAGETAAKEAAEELQTALSEHWESLFEGLRQPLSQVDQAVENQLVHLSKALARAICWNEVQTNDDIIREAFQRGIQQLGMSTQRVEVYAHPEDFALLDARWDERTRHEKGWFLYQDESVTRGGCRIQTPLVNIDVSLEARMEEVFAQLLKGVKEIPNEKPQTTPPTSASEALNSESEQQHDTGESD